MKKFEFLFYFILIDLIYYVVNNIIFSDIDVSMKGVYVGEVGVFRKNLYHNKIILYKCL